MRRALALATVLSVALVAPAQARTARPSPEAQSGTDAHALARAHTTHARIAAIEKIADHLELGVYTANGHRVVRGSERGKFDLYLYEPEVRALALGIGRRKSFADLAASYARLGARFSGRVLDGKGFAELVATRVRAAQRNGHASFAYAALLLRSLGLARRVDLARSVDPSAAVLDPVQMLILDLGVVRPAMVGAARAHHRAADPARPAPTARSSSVCDDPLSSQTATTIGGAQGLTGLFSNTFGKIAGTVSGVSSLTDLFHGIVLGIDIDFRAAGPTTVLGRFGTNGLHSAADMQFKAQVYMTVNLPKSVVDCGALLGYTFPTSGGVSGIKVAWKLAAAGANLGELSTINCDRSSCQSTAGDSGIATLTVKPDDEWLPGAGDAVSASGAVQASAETLRSTGSGLGKIDEGILGIAKFVTFGWTMSWHQPRGYQVTLPALNESQTIAGTELDTSVSYDALVQCVISGRDGSTVPHPTIPRPALGTDAFYPGPRNTEKIVNTADGHSFEQDIKPFEVNASVNGSKGESYEFVTTGGQTVTVHPQFTFSGANGVLDDRLDVPSALTPGSRDVTGTLSDVPSCPAVPIPGS
jgi:hypothetical protein